MEFDIDAHNDRSLNKELSRYDEQVKRHNEIVDIVKELMRDHDMNPYELNEERIISGRELDIYEMGYTD